MLIIIVLVFIVFFVYIFDVDFFVDVSIKFIFLNELFVIVFICKFCFLNFKVLFIELGDVSSFNFVIGKFCVFSNFSNFVFIVLVVFNIVILYEFDKLFYFFGFNF